MESNSKSIYYPPGGILLWIIIYLELITFGMAMLAFAYYGVQEQAVFAESAKHLNKGIATANTILLLTSGYFVAMSVVAFNNKNIKKTTRYLNFSMLLGFGFLILKGIEYYLKIESGFTMNTNSFFMYYWLLTGFHWIHVLVGLVILFFIKIGIQKKQNDYSLEDFEAGATFWHMCDIIWLLLFPVLYLMF